MKIGFIGLGNVGGKLAGSLLRNNFDLTVRDLDETLTNSLKDLGAKVAKSPKELAEQSDLIITSLPSPEVSAEVMESEDGILNGLSENKIWLEMSTTDENEVKRLGKKVIEKKAIPLDGPVSGGCHRAATGNIAIFVGGERKAFEKILPVLTVMGRKILHTGDLGTASILKVITNYLASAHLVALGEAWTVAKKSNLDLAKTYKGIAISSGNSFVHETESQVILNGSYNINFTMDLVLKDTSLFDNLAKKLNAPLEISPQIVEIFKDGQKKYGSRAWSSMIVKRMEDLNNINFRANGFPEKNDFEVINPCNEDPFAIISLGSKEDIDLAVKSAKDAFETWKETSKEERLSLLKKLSSIYKKRFNEMAEAISLEMGAPMDWATDVQTASGKDHLDDFILRLKNFKFDEHFDNKSNNHIYYEPLELAN